MSDDGFFTYIDLSAVNASTKAIVAPKRVALGNAPSRARQLVKAEDVLVSTVRPNLNSVAFVPDELNGTVASTGFCVLRPDKSRLHSRYLFHWVRGEHFVADMVRRATGASYPAVSDTIVKDSRIPLPPLPEQRRIAAILDQADELRTERRRALALLDELVGSLFLATLGNEEGWPRVQLGELLEIPLRNGVSPSSNGRFEGTVLTLSAITRGTFEPEAKKGAMFDKPLDPCKSIHEGELLICRGNGNKDLVGRAEIADISIPGVAFPDTMIAARLNRDLMDGAFLREAWHRPSVRRQIDGGARTTNGTFKVNQQLLESVVVPAPPLSKQMEFSAKLSRVRQRSAIDLSHLRVLDELFSSLQHRAFSGEL